MSKFNLKIGDGLLNEASRKLQQQSRFEILNIPLSSIETNNLNKPMSIENIEEMKEAILEVGLQQNLVVFKVGNKYRLLTGHRRYKALTELYNEGHTEYETAPCLVKSFDEVKAEISNEGKEKYLLAITNTENRKNTPAENLFLLQLMNEVFDEMKANGKSVGRRRDYVASQLGISPTAVHNLEFVDKNLEDSVKDKVMSQEIPMTAGMELAKQDKQTQVEVVNRITTESANEDVTVEKVKKTIKQLNGEKAELDQTYTSTSKYLVESTIFTAAQDSLKNIVKRLDKKTVFTGKTNYKQITNIAANIENQIEKLSEMIDKELNNKKEG